jgi:uncharacterized protein YdhG (YjbR/CyaY superfamily)
VAHLRAHWGAPFAATRWALCAYDPQLATTALNVVACHGYHPAMRLSKKSTETKAAGKPARRPRSSAYGGAKTIDEYLARIEPDQRAALEALRRVIRKAAPKAEEVITYGIPAFKQNGFLLGFAASAKHCSLHPMNNHTVADFASELAGYSMSTGTIRFTPDKPLPVAVVTKIVKARIAENAADAKEKAAMKGRS